MESEFKRRMMHFSRNFQDEGERSNVSSTTTLIEARRRIELLTSRSHNYQFSRHQEDITTRVIHQGVACHDSCIAKYLHQDDRLTTERSLVEKKPEPHRKYTPLQNFMSSSDEALDLEKLKRENLSLRYKIKKVCGEKEEILKENNFLKEELNRERMLRKDCCRSLMYRDKLLSLVSKEYKNCLVTILQKSTEVEKAKESLEKMKLQMLEKELKKEWLQASTGNLKCKHSKESRQNVHKWLQVSLKNLKEDSNNLSRHTLPEWLKASVINLEKERPEASREDVKEWLNTSINHLQEKGPETSPINVEGWLEASIKSIQDLQKYEAESRSSLRKGWLEKSIENLKKQGSVVPLENTSQWLEGSLKSLSSSKASKPVLELWLRDSLKNLEEESPKTSNQDVKEWLKMSVNNLEEEGPEAPHLTPQEWLKESIKSIQDLQKSMISVQNSLRDGWIEKSIQDLKKQYSEEPAENILQWLQTSLENLSVSEEHTPVLKKWLEESLENLNKESPEGFKEDAKTWLLKKSKEKLEDGINNGWLGKSTEDLQNQYSEGPLENILQRLQSSVESQSFYKEPDPVLENLEQESRDKSKYIKKWLEMSINNLEPEGPEVPHLDSQEWLKASIKGIEDFKKQSSKTPKLSLGYSKESVVQVLESSFPKRGLRNGWLQETLASSREHGSIASRTSVQAWLKTSLERLKQDSSEGAKNNLKEWLQDSIENIQMECPKESIPYAKEWLDTVMNQFQEGGSETSYLSVEEWLKTSIQGLKEEIFEEMTGGKDPKIWTTKVSKRIPSQEKTLRNELNKLWMCSRKKQEHILKTCGFILLAMFFIFFIYVHVRLYCIESKQGFRPY